MRPKLVALLAVPVLALAGCSAAEPAPVPAERPSASAVSSEPRPTSIDDLSVDSDEATQAEVGFIEVAQLRATSHGLPEFDPQMLIASLHEFCDSGEPMGLTEDEDVNEALDHIASMGACEKIGR